MLIGSLLVLASTAFTWLACALFEPHWETNDDVAMSMVAHGYGGAAQPSPDLVQAFGRVQGIPGYTLATYACLVIIGAVLLWAARQTRLGVLGAAALFVLLLLRPLLFPQFTLTSGLLMLASGACLAWYPASGARLQVWLAAALALASFLVRREEFLLVLLVLAPVLPWRALAQDRSSRIAAAVLVAVLAVSALADRAAYRAPDWAEFNALNPERAAFTDYRRGERLKAQPELMRRHGLSVNDVELVEGWFFSDPVLVDPARLKSVLAELGEVRDWKARAANAQHALTRLTHPRLFWTLLCAAALALLFPSWRLFLAWILWLAALTYLGYLGRPGVLHVYTPVVAALLFAPLLHRAWQPGGAMDGEARSWRQRVAAFLIAACAIADAPAVLYEARLAGERSRAIRAEVVDFPRETVVVWGDVFPFEAVYAPFVRGHADSGPRIYGLGVFTLAPFSVAYAETREGRDMLNLLLSKEGVLLLSRSDQVTRLGIYCREHFGATLEERTTRTFSFGTVRRLRCPGWARL